MRKLAILLVILLLISASAVVADAPSSQALSGLTKGAVVWATNTGGTQFMYERGEGNTWLLLGERSSPTESIRYYPNPYLSPRTSEVLATRFQETQWTAFNIEVQPATATVPPAAPSTPAPTPPAETTAPTAPAPVAPTTLAEETAGPETTASAEGETAQETYQEREPGLPGTTPTEGAAGPEATAPGATGGPGAEQGLGATEEEISLQQMEKGPAGGTPPAQQAPTAPGGQTVLGRTGGATVSMNSNGQVNYYRDDGTQITGADLEKYKSDNFEELNGANYEQKAKDEMVKQGTFLTNFVQSYRIYSGLQGYSSLIFDKEFLADWRKKVNDIFCNKVLGYLPLSRDCWTSTVCGIYTEITPPQDGVLFTAPIGGLPMVAAHIEGERSLPIVTPSQTSWVYKVTFSVTNPLDETLKINVYFQSAEKKAAWWPADQEVGEGNTFAAVGASALMKLSSTDYSEVCLSFSPSLESFGGRRTGSICNGIPQYAGGATAPYSVTTGNETTAQPGAAPSTPTAPGANI